MPGLFWTTYYTFSSALALFPPTICDLDLTENKAVSRVVWSCFKHTNMSWTILSRVVLVNSCWDPCLKTMGVASLIFSGRQWIKRSSMTLSYNRICYRHIWFIFHAWVNAFGSFVLYGFQYCCLRLLNGTMHMVHCNLTWLNLAQCNAR